MHAIRVVTRLELLRMSKQESRNHLHYAEQLRVLNDKQVVLAKLRITLIARSELGVAAHDVRQCFDESQALQQEQWYAAALGVSARAVYHLARVESHRVVDDSELVLNLVLD